jgi:nucleoside-diphosphate-sugar epimerase
MNALVIGGTGPTGPHVVEGLIERGYDVTIFHRGVHEVAEMPPVEHIHGDPHFPETIARARGDRRWDVVIASYGRLRHLAEAFAGRCQQFIGIGGALGYHQSLTPGKAVPFGVPIPVTEDAPEEEDLESFSAKVRGAERTVLELGRSGAFLATMYRYPYIVGPRQIAPAEWLVVKRVLDGRRRMILPDRGLFVLSRMSARNAAHAVLLSVDHPEAAGGKVYNCRDTTLLSLRQWMEVIAELMGAEIEMVSMPYELATTMHGMGLAGSSNFLLDNSRICEDLGYRDVVSFRDAMRETIAWYEEYPVTREDYPWLADPFDYDAEDRLIAAYGDAVERLLPMAGTSPGNTFHPYPHPVRPGEARDQRQR